jgi:hypothetical protein
MAIIILNRKKLIFIQFQIIEIKIKFLQTLFHVYSHFLKTSPKLGYMLQEVHPQEQDCIE